MGQAGEVGEAFAGETLEEKDIADTRGGFAAELMVAYLVALLDGEIERSVVALAFDGIGAEGAIVGATGIHAPVKEGTEVLGKLRGGIVAALADACAVADLLHNLLVKIGILMHVFYLMPGKIPDGFDQRSVGIVEREPECGIQGEEGMGVLLEEFEPLQEQTGLIVFGATAEITRVAAEILIPELPDGGVLYFCIVADELLREFAEGLAGPLTKGVCHDCIFKIISPTLLLLRWVILVI